MKCGSTPDSLSDYTNLFALIDAGSSYTNPNYVSLMENQANMENWMRLVAANHAAGNWDCWGVQNGQNIYGYVSPNVPWTLFMFDFSIVLGNRIGWRPGQNLFTTMPAFDGFRRQQLGGDHGESHLPAHVCAGAQGTGERPDAAGQHQHIARGEIRRVRRRWFVERAIPLRR